MRGTETVAPAAKHLVTTLKELGARVAFGVPGIHNLALWDAIADDGGVRVITVHHEQAAAYAADGYARATGTPGVCLTTTGPAAANTVAAVGEAWAARSPVIVIASDVATTLRRTGVVRGSLHECANQAAIFAPVTKAQFTVDRAPALAATLTQAWRIAEAAPARPVYVGVPTDLFTAAVARDPVIRTPAAPRAPSAEAIVAASSLLDQSRRITIWAGGGAVASGAGPAIGDLARHLGAPVVTTHRARGLIAPDHPCYVGLPPHEPAVEAVLAGADCLLAFGTDFDGPMTRNWTMRRPPRLVNVNVDREDLDKNFAPEVALEADAALAAVTLRERCRERQPDLGALRGRLDGMRTEIWEELAAPATAPALRFLEALQRTLPKDARVVTDMTLSGHWVAHYLEIDAPRRIFSPAWGTLGMALPASIGIALAGGWVLTVVGDGGFLSTAGELNTIARESLPVVTLIVDDAGFGALRYGKTGAPRQGVDWRSPDFTAWARAMGMPAARVRDLAGELKTALRNAFERTGPSLIVAEASLAPPRSISLRWSAPG